VAVRLRPRHFDWSLRSCGLHGHITYRPDEPELAERLRADTAAGEAWRCLRCESYVAGPPHGSGPAEDAPLVLRGRALRDAFVLRLLALERFIRGLLLVALSYGVYRFNGARDALQRVFDDYLPTLRPLADKLGVDLQHTGPVKLIEEALNARHSTLTLVAFGVLGYGALQLLEGIGLWLMKRWGEYVAVVGTSLFIPLEVYEIAERVTWLRVVALGVNVFAVVYLLWTKRLFGLRGGHAAFAAERHGQSLLEVERAALARVGGEPLSSTPRRGDSASSAAG
jgi:uncharacterized membrane protein (DUF2068 family)